MSRIKVALFVFVSVSILDIIGVIFSIPYLIFIFKPFILLSLLLLYHVSVSEKNSLYVSALFFSFLGDVFLIYKGSFSFNIGLLSFLIAHLFFIKIVISQIKKKTILKVIYSIIPFFILFLMLFLFLKNALNDLLIPVLIYGITISIFGAVSVINYLGIKSRKSLLMLGGAILFIFSDSVLAINKFYNSSHLFEIIIIITYIIAQYLIFRSMVHEDEI